MKTGQHSQRQIGSRVRDREGRWGYRVRDRQGAAEVRDREGKTELEIEGRG